MGRFFHLPENPSNTKLLPFLFILKYFLRSKIRRKKANEIKNVEHSGFYGTVSQIAK